MTDQVARALDTPRAPWRSRLAGLAAVLAGLSLPFAFAPWGYWPLGLLSPAALFLCWRGAAPGRAAWLGFLYGFAAFLSGTWWTYISVHEFGQAPRLLAAFLTLALAALMAGYYALLGWLAARWLPAGGALRWLVGLPAAWTAIEWLRGWFLSGFPWLSLGYSQTDSVLGALAPVIGVYGVGWVCALSAGAIVALLAEDMRRRALAVAALFVVFAAAGAAGRGEWTEPAGAPVRAVMVQGAVGQDEKWLDTALAPTRELYLALTEPHWGADLVIWPEAAIPALLHQETDFIQALDARARASGSELLLGILERDPVRGQYHNILLALGGTPEIYRKRQLVPFGEYFPVPAFVRRWMRLMNLPYTDFAPGRPDPSPMTLAGVRVAPTICYEDAFGAQQRVFFPGAELLVNVSNDAWFGDTVAPHQHLQIARMRAMETGRWMLRATNNGVTAVIDPRGRVTQRSRQFVTAVVETEVTPMRGLTPWLRYGDWPLAALAAVLVLLAALRRNTAAL
ncbi:MAG TPA: apolipoprotein N-acyltransferase [Gammaproteobacteria bacterium]|nr:apolipoprotein N-acyltransferase [Gammaproteobacteria bacterium]